mmetsp:Transcript_3506/g.7707  ORF Transcript_3506/g.7707 Transcript_3506/m.7707 type:complete len:252 (-) Transcript_3506:147-902(-)
MRRPEERAERVGSAASEVPKLLRGVEIRQLDHAFFGHQNVPALDVVVDDAPAVQEVESHQDLVGVSLDDRLIQRAVGRDQRLDAPARNVLEEDVQTRAPAPSHPLVGVALCPEVAHDVRMAQPAHDVDLPLQRLHRLLPTLAVRDAQQRDLLHRHQLPSVGIDTLKDPRVRPFSDQPPDPPSERAASVGNERGALVRQPRRHHLPRGSLGYGAKRARAGRRERHRRGGADDEDFQLSLAFEARHAHRFRLL